MSMLERLWAYALLAGAAAMAVYTVLTWSRGWIWNQEEDEIVYRKDHPRGFAFAQLLQLSSYWSSVQGWK
ncbi:MAG TPA: hypothetical protein VJ753_03055 [Rhizomicrobium sp.]|nr:hypothetical protein [Rhizomicrobium sp.]